MHRQQRDAGKIEETLLVMPVPDLLELPQSHLAALITVLMHVGIFGVPSILAGSIVLDGVVDVA